MSLFDESAVVAGHLRHAASIHHSLSTLEICSALIRSVLLNKTFDEPNQVALMILGFRIANNIGAGTVLIERGYFISAIALQRDLAEIAALALYFAAHPAEIGKWRSSEGLARYRAFNFGKLVKTIDANKRDFLRPYFDQFSEIGVHPSSLAAAVHFHNGEFHNGPYVNPRLYCDIHKEMAKLAWHTTDAAGECWSAVTGVDLNAQYAAELNRFREAFNAWEKDSTI